ncbi:hypothetical protein QTP88_012249 [Uroleucon formosanum]
MSQSPNKNINKNKNANIQAGRLNKQHIINNITLNATNPSSSRDNIDDSSNGEWTHIPSKRHLSDSSDPLSPDPTINKNKKLFITKNRYEPLQAESQIIQNSTTDTQKSTSETPNYVNPIKPPPPIFVKGIVNFPDLCAALIEKFGVDNFFCKSSTDSLKIQTANPDAYRTLVHFLRDQNAQFHTYQLREDKPTRVVLRNLHSSTSTELIKSELELRLFETSSSQKFPVTYTIQLIIFWILTPTIRPSFSILMPLHKYVKLVPNSLRQQLIDLNFITYIAEEINLKISLKSAHEIDDAVNNLTTLIQSAASKSNPQNTTNNSVHKYLFVSEQVRSLIVEKRRARARYQITRLPSHKSAYNKLANSLKKCLTKNKADMYEHKQTSLSSVGESLWRETKKLFQYKSPSVPLKKPDNSFAFTGNDKAEVFKSHLHETFQPHHDIHTPENIDEVNTYPNLPSTLNQPEKYFTPNEVKQTIQKYSLKKSPGFDLITAEVARCLPKKAIVLITYIFNASLRLSRFPMLWKFSKIVLFSKPDKPLDTPTSFRPISLLPFFSKVLERLILKRLMPHIITNNILPNTQFGFRNSHRTIHQLYRVVYVISTSLEKKLYCSCIFLDVAQAFDRVWHEGLQYKLKKCLPSPLYLLIKSYLTDKHFQV